MRKEIKKKKNNREKRNNSLGFLIYATFSIYHLYENVMTIME